MYRDTAHELLSGYYVAVLKAWISHCFFCSLESIMYALFVACYTGLLLVHNPYVLLSVGRVDIMTEGAFSAV